MLTDHPAFIQCANEAYEQGAAIDEIECLCRNAPTASSPQPDAMLELASFTREMKRL